MDKRIKKITRGYHTITACGLALYAVNCFDTSAQIGVIPYLNTILPHASQVLGIGFVLSATLMVNSENPVKMRHYVLLLIPQLLYSSVTIQWFLTSSMGLNLGVLWLHPFVSALLLAYSWIIPELIATIKAVLDGSAKPPSDN